MYVDWDERRELQLLRNNKLERVYFPVPPVCLYLPKQSKEWLVRELDRCAALVADSVLAGQSLSTVSERVALLVFRYVGDPDRMRQSG